MQERWKNVWSVSDWSKIKGVKVRSGNVYIVGADEVEDVVRKD